MTEQRISRADFLKTGALVGLGAVSASALAGCSAQAGGPAEADPAQEPAGSTPTYTPYQLSEIEAISQLQADYWWYMDTKQWDVWADVFTEDFLYYSWGEKTTSTRDEFIAMNKESLAHFNTAHQGHQHKVVLTSDTTAEGRWILNDNLSYINTDQEGVIKGYGYYLNDYEKGEDGKWRLKVQRLGYFRFEGPTDIPAKLGDKVPYDTDLV